ncbi:DUF899 domain-containing protein [Erythrobacter arachoides]|uniref:DUF899 domain-containing protein n=1 Tax=Aurantiacibacter arachoides TaxID=1850444 RepID=A0A845A2D4_9SPHN|nr:DUF899 family protein [Aurantiacibacter arachoides]MXO93602.1 DUF899 domain-containing protein [Aurantiacibacter arachoides]GGD48132.1 hypothetical protein GCM10011411_04810 [Aurantiacibacter arachoides]
MTGLRPAAKLAELRNRPLPGESAAYAEARKALLAEEIAVRRHLTRLAEQRQALPDGPVVQEDYRFRDASGKEVGLIDLFGERDSLVVYFQMYGPERAQPCPMCTNFIAGVSGNVVDIQQRAAFKVAARSPVERQQAVAQDRGLPPIDFVQSLGDAFAIDHGALDPDDGAESPALIVFRRDGDVVRYFYAAEMPAEAADPGQDPRGPVDIAPLWNVLDLTPQGRGADWYPKVHY